MLSRCSLEHLCHAADRLELAADCPTVPTVEEPPGIAGIAILPEPTKLLLNRPCTRGLQILIFQCFKVEPAVFAQVLWVEKPKLLAAFQMLVAGLLQRLVFLTANLVDRLVQVLADMKAVVDDLRLLGVRFRRVDVGWPYIHRDRLHLALLLLRNGLPQRIGRFLGAAFDHFQDARGSQVREQRYVALPATKALLVDAHMRHRLQVATRQSPLNRALHNAMHAVPIEPQQAGRRFHVAASQDDLDRQRLEQQGKPRVLTCPGDGRGLHAARLAVGPGHAGAEPRLELHRVQMPPGPLGRMIGNRACPAAFRARHPAADVRHQDVHTPLFQGKRDVGHFPGSVQAQQQAVVFCELAHAGHCRPSQPRRKECTHENP